MKIPNRKATAGLILAPILIGSIAHAVDSQADSTKKTPVNVVANKQVIEKKDVTPKNHVVKAGDTLWQIANSYKITVEDLKNMNNLETEELQIGQVLELNSSENSKKSQSLSKDNLVVKHKVKIGDTLWEISRQYGVSVERITDTNKLENETIVAGTELIIKKDAFADVLNLKGYYEVAKGDTVNSIAAKHGITGAQLKKTNHLVSDYLYVGRILAIKKDNVVREHIIAHGETLNEIASKYSVSIESLKVENGLTYSDINIGTKLVIPTSITKKESATVIKDFNWSKYGNKTFPIGSSFKIIDEETKFEFYVTRTVNESGLTVEPLSSLDETFTAGEIREIIIEVENDRIQASMSISDTEEGAIKANNFKGVIEIGF